MVDILHRRERRNETGIPSFSRDDGILGGGSEEVKGKR
jgi:hypothetical protein